MRRHADVVFGHELSSNHEVLTIEGWRQVRGIGQDTFIVEGSDEQFPLHGVAFASRTIEPLRTVEKWIRSVYDEWENDYSTLSVYPDHFIRVLAADIVAGLMPEVSK